MTISSRLSRFAGVMAVALLLSQAVTPATPAARADEFRGNDLRDIRIGMRAADLPKEGYVDFACADDPKLALDGWASWKDCPADAAALRAIRFGYDPLTSREGTMVAGHPAVLTLLVDEAGQVAGLRIETDPKARLYIRKKAFLLGLQAKSRYGDDGWSCVESQPQGGEQSVGGVYLKERCTKTISGRALVVERNLFRRSDQDEKNFVDETRISILRSKS
ncbi:hypothetical protein [Bradyrhizobium prioriisuperbiae]|uniref:hypothetical protein n=1 Tax=Bradyrhizobium prioriisuperbiae TaxID=2854389 RepID=UPI0028EB852D|nr:hypothetical protein [Bradyrhizobium prioritasuperba]